MKLKFEILQLEKLGKKQQRFIVRENTKVGRIEVSSLVFGPTTLKNCENFLKRKG